MDTNDARVWVTARPPTFPELTPALTARTANTGICLSGGGTRAMAAGIGQLRGLAALGLLGDIRYISAVSGGTWVSAPFLFAPQDEATLLGPPEAPETLTLQSLGELPKAALGHLATASLRDRLLKLLGDVPEARVWIDAVSEEFLRPLGLYDPANVAFVAQDAARIAAIVARNPALASMPFHLPRLGRPFLICNGCIIGPKSLTPLKRESPVSLEMTPMYAGSPVRLEVAFESQHATSQTEAVGGGYIESFAFGGPSPGPLKIEPGASADVPLPVARFGWTLGEMIGVSSSAFAGYAEQEHLIDALNGLAPIIDLWDLPGDGISQPFAVGDGGVLENYGIIPLVLRGVDRIVVFVNTGTRLNPSFDASQPTQWKGIDDYLPALFGYAVDGTGTDLQNNHVFEQGQFQGLVDGLVAAKKAGGGIIAETTLTTVDNRWWGVQGGRAVQVAWVYNDRVSDWEAKLHPEVRDAIEKGNHDWLFTGPVPLFPNYETAGENALEIIELTPTQVNLLADLTCWTVTHNADLFRRMLGR